MVTHMLFGGLGLPEILVIVLIFLLLFGAKKIPEVMKGLGKGIRSFKEGLNDTGDADKKQDSTDGNKPQDNQ